MRSSDVGVVSRDARAWAAAAAATATVATLLFAACTDSHGNGSGTPGSTETGNPPVIDVSRVALVVSSDEVHVVGEPGAVTPASGEAVVETLSGGDVQRAPVEDDGSFDVLVTGTLYDTYLLHVEGSGDAGVSEPVYLNRGGAMVGVPDPGSLSCDQREQEIIDQLTQAEATASRACDSNSDCFFWPPFSICPYWHCEGAVVSEVGRAEFDTAVAAIENSLCVPFAEHGCPNGPAGCGPRVAVACVDGQCTNCRTGECPETTCAQCETPDISWSTSFARTMSGTYSITDCARFTHELPGGAACSRELPCIAPPSVIADRWSVAQLQNAVGNPDVTAALAAQGTYGAIAPGGYAVTIRIGDGQVTVHNECPDVEPCADIPEGVRVLRDMLEQIATQQECVAEPTTACQMPFDPGDGPGTIFVYAFHPQSGACVPQVYSGAGGNANRFDDAASCRAACPTTATESGCPPNRTYVTDACLECGLAGGCSESTAACALLCTTAADCNGEGVGLTCGARGFCEISGCL